MIEITEDMHDQDRAVYDGLQSEPPTDPRFFTPVSFVPVIPPVPKSTGYNAFDSFTEKDWEDWNSKRTP